MERIPFDNEDVFVEIIDLGSSTISETVVRNDDGSFTVFINARFSFERQQEPVQHALRHLEHNDFDKDNVQQIEFEAHQLLSASPHGLGVQSKEDDKTTNQRNKKLADEAIKRRKRYERRHKKRQKLLDEYEAFANKMRDENPDFYYRHQDRY